jgi:hypothetical protein
MSGLNGLRVELSGYEILGSGKPAGTKWMPQLVIRRSTGDQAHVIDDIRVLFDAQDTAQRVAVEYGRALVLGLASPLPI